GSWVIHLRGKFSWVGFGIDWDWTSSNSTRFFFLPDLERVTERSGSLIPLNPGIVLGCSSPSGICILILLESQFFYQGFCERARSKNVRIVELGESFTNS
ncbi:hypothetical protein GIB67_018971, partial [Kingdonia uniflora]